MRIGWSWALAMVVGGICRPSAASAQATDAVVFLGSYEQVTSATGEHCDGYTVEIWQYGDRPFGLFHHHAGLCGDPPCGVLTGVRYDAGAGDLRFDAETAISRVRFVGALTPESLSGSLREARSPDTTTAPQPVVLSRHHDTDAFHAAVRTLAAWHTRYDGVARCLGVRDYMPPSR